MEKSMMAGFKKGESPEEFKHRLNSLTEKLNKINKNSVEEGAAGNQRIHCWEA
jgi:hypothetical protein